MAKREPVGPLYGNRIVTQEIMPPFDFLCGVEIQVATYRERLRGPLRVRLVDGRGRVRGVSEQELDSVRDNSRLLLWLAPVSRSRGRRFRVELSAPMQTREKPVTAWKDVPDRQTALGARCWYDGNLVNGGLSRRLFFAGLGLAEHRITGPSADVRVTDGEFSEALLAQQSQTRYLRWCSRVSISPFDRVLEVGCGMGELGSVWAKRCARYLGLEENPFMRRWARRRLEGVPDTEIGSLRREVLEDLPEASFDIVILRPMMIVGSERERYLWLREIKRVLNRGGLLLVDTADLRSAIAWKMAMGLDDAEKAIRSIEPPGLTKRFCAQLDSTGFRIDSMRGQNGHFELVCLPDDLYNSAMGRFPSSSSSMDHAERS